VHHRSEVADKFVLRLPDGMRDRIRTNAESNRRSMNSEIVHYLDRALAAEEKKGPAEVAASPSHGPNNVLENADEHGQQ
jgi:plasmid stability protein